MSDRAAAVLDAAVIVAFLDKKDQHHRAAHDLLRECVGLPKVMSSLNYAEALVGPTRHGQVDRARNALESLRIQCVPISGDDALRLAAIRVETGSKMPDCCVLLVAERHDAAVATFDHRLQSSARQLGLPVL